jgi:hypothetical protein
LSEYVVFLVSLKIFEDEYDTSEVNSEVDDEDDGQQYDCQVVAKKVIETIELEGTLFANYYEADNIDDDSKRNDDLENIIEDEKADGKDDQPGQYGQTVSIDATYETHFSSKFCCWVS